MTAYNMRNSRKELEFTGMITDYLNGSRNPTELRIKQMYTHLLR